MRTSFWMMFFCITGLLSIASVGKSYRKYAEDEFPALDKKSDLVVQTPICLDRSDIPDEELHWLYIPSTPTELATNEYYGYLSGQLIQTGVVDASDCPLNGLWPNGYANSCGLQRAHDVAIELQNVYDNEILVAGNKGVPPVMIKQLIRYESQFWPIPMRFYHFGLGHLTNMGAKNVLMWSPKLYGEICRSTFISGCRKPFSELPSETQSILAGRLLSRMDASCPTCSFKIDIPKAEQSITYIAEALMAYCRQTSQIVYNATEEDAADVVGYATIWKLTLLNYNVGPSCVYSAVQAGYNASDLEEDEKLGWDVIVDNINITACLSGVDYVENITGKYYDFGTPP